MFEIKTENSPLVYQMFAIPAERHEVLAAKLREMISNINLEDFRTLRTMHTYDAALLANTHVILQEISKHVESAQELAYVVFYIGLRLRKMLMREMVNNRSASENHIPGISDAEAVAYWETFLKKY